MPPSWPYSWTGLWTWPLFIVLLAALLLATLRWDWLKLWWIDQLRHPPGSPDLPDDLDPGEPMNDTGTRQSAHPEAPRAVRPVHAPRQLPPGTPSPVTHRPSYHRSGRRH